MLQCAPYIKNLCQTLNHSWGPDEQKSVSESCTGSSTIDKSVTEPNCVASLQSNGAIVHRTTRVLPAVSSGQRPNPPKIPLVMPSLKSVPPSPNSMRQPSKATLVTSYSTGNGGLTSIKHVIPSRGSTLPLSHEPKSIFSQINGVIERKALNGSLGGSVLGSLPNLGTISKESTLVGVKLRSGSFTSSESKVGTNVLKSTNLLEFNGQSGDQEYILTAASNVDNSQVFVRSTFGAHACLVSRKLLGYNSLTRPPRNIVGTSSPPTLIPLSSISSTSSSAASLSEISEEVLPQSSSELGLFYNNIDNGTSFCTALDTSTTSSICFLTSSSARSRECAQTHQCLHDSVPSDRTPQW